MVHPSLRLLAIHTAFLLRVDHRGAHVFGVLLFSLRFHSILGVVKVNTGGIGTLGYCKRDHLAGLRSLDLP